MINADNFTLVNVSDIAFGSAPAGTVSQMAVGKEGPDGKPVKAVCPIAKRAVRVLFGVTKESGELAWVSWSVLRDAYGATQPQYDKAYNREYNPRVGATKGTGAAKLTPEEKAATLAAFLQA